MSFCWSIVKSLNKEVYLQASLLIINYPLAVPLNYYSL